MKLLRIALIAGALSVLATASQAQIIIHWIPWLTNYVTNGGFESGTTDWNESNSYFDGEDMTYMNLGQAVKDAHSGTWGLDMELGYSYGYNGFYYSDLRQNLSTPVAVSSLVDGYVWCQSSGNYLSMYVTYTDGTSGGGSFYIDSEEAAQGSNGFVEWNFLPLLNKSKTIKAIDFNAVSYEGGDITIDDVNLDTVTYFYIN